MSLNVNHSTEQDMDAFPRTLALPVSGEAGVVYQMQYTQRQIRAFLTGDDEVTFIFGRDPLFIVAGLCRAAKTLTGKDYDESPEGLTKAWRDLEERVVAWQSPYGEGWKA